MHVHVRPFARLTVCVISALKSFLRGTPTIKVKISTFIQWVVPQGGYNNAKNRPWPRNIVE